MYNSTDCEDIDAKTACVDYIISLATISSLFIVSEILPFLKSHEGNGLVDLVICLLGGSECCLSKLIECLKGEKEKDDGIQQEQQQSLNNENATKQSVNININTDNK
jgi:hypothetical protein